MEKLTRSVKNAPLHFRDHRFSNKFKIMAQ